MSIQEYWNGTTYEMNLDENHPDWGFDSKMDIMDFDGVDLDGEHEDMMWKNGQHNEDIHTKQKYDEDDPVMSINEEEKLRATNCSREVRCPPTLEDIDGCPSLPKWPNEVGRNDPGNCHNLQTNIDFANNLCTLVVAFQNRSTAVEQTQFQNSALA